jgi:uncharacterized protein (TIGR00251 family)
MAMLAVYVTPKASRDEVAGWRGAELAVRVTSAPEEGKANASVCKTVARALGVPRTAISVVRGETARHKLLEISGVDDDAVRAVLGEPEPSLFSESGGKEEL